LISTPSVLAKYDPAAFPNIKIVATAGEPSNQKYVAITDAHVWQNLHKTSLADLWASHGRTYYNCCGPTETTIVNTMHKHTFGTPLSIGRPTPNNAVYILSEDLEQVPVGTVGVMWAGGAGVARGYIALPDKTAEKFIGDKFRNDG